MQFGVMNFPVRPILLEIESAAGMKMDYLELAMDPPEAHFSRLGAQASDIRAGLKRHHLGIIGHMPTFVYTADLSDAIRRASVQEVLHSLETASDLGIRKAVLHPGYCSGLAVYVMEHARALAMESLATICRRADELGIVLCFENLISGGSPFVEPWEFDPLFEAFPRMKLALDTGHAHIGEKAGRRAIDFIERHASRLAHVHLSDNSGTRDEHLPIGRGGIDFDAVGLALRRAGYDGDATLEIFGADRSALIRSRKRFVAIMAAA